MPGSVAVEIKPIIWKLASVAESGTTSVSVQTPGGYFLSAIGVPTGFTGTTIKFDTSQDGVTYRRHIDNAGDEYTLTVAAGRNTTIDPEWFAAWPFLRLIVAAQNDEVDIELGYI